MARTWLRNPLCRVLKIAPDRKARAVVHDGGAGGLRRGTTSQASAWSRLPRITIDLDPTDDPTQYGQQEFTFFNSHYDSYCYLPMVCFLTFNEEAEQYLVAAVLRREKCDWFGGCGGDSAPSDCTGERGFSQGENPGAPGRRLYCPEVLDFLDYEPKVEYLVNLAANAVL